MMSSNCELTGEPAENAKDIVFVTITGPAKWLAGPSLLKSDAAPGVTFQSLLRNELTTLQTQYRDACRIFVSVYTPTVFCMAGSPRKYELPGSLLADPCDAVLVDVVARCGSDITAKTLSSICDEVASFLTKNTNIDNKFIFKLAGGVYTPWNKISEESCSETENA